MVGLWFPVASSLDEIHPRTDKHVETFKFIDIFNFQPVSPLWMSVRMDWDRWRCISEPLGPLNIMTQLLSGWILIFILRVLFWTQYLTKKIYLIFHPRCTRYPPRTIMFRALSLRQGNILHVLVLFVQAWMCIIMTDTIVLLA